MLPPARFAFLYSDEMGSRSLVTGPSRARRRNAQHISSHQQFWYQTVLIFTDGNLITVKPMQSNATCHGYQITTHCYGLQPAHAASKLGYKTCGPRSVCGSPADLLQSCNWSCSDCRMLSTSGIRLVLNSHYFFRLKSWMLNCSQQIRDWGKSR
jgi:hypothetical protein